MKSKESKWRNFMALLPILLVNGIAIYGQTMFWHAHLTWPIGFAILFALALESVAIFLAYHAHLAQLSNDSSGRLRLASYAIGLIIGLMNGSHYLGPNGALTAAALGMGIMSAISPWLWAVHSRRQSRDQLKSNGLIEEHALRLGFMRWLLWPREAWDVFRYSVWNGHSGTPRNSINEYEARFDRFHFEEDTEEELQAIAAPPFNPDPELIGYMEKGQKGPQRKRSKKGFNKTQAIKLAIETLGGNATNASIAMWLDENGYRGVSSNQIRTIKGQVIHS